MLNISFTIDKYALQLIRDSDLQYPIGTGFCFLRPNWIATAKHVVLVDGLPRHDLVVQFINGPSLGAEVYAWHPEIDVAILRTLHPSPCRTPLFPAYAHFTGQDGLISAGYMPSRSEKDKSSYSIVVNQVECWELEYRSRMNSEEEVIIFPSAHVEPGHSGGPLFGQGGGVVGIVIEAFAQEGEPYARGTSILSLLDGIEMRQDWRLNLCPQRFQLEKSDH